MAIKTREELEQELEDIKSRLSVIETSQTQPKDDEPSEEPSEPEEYEQIFSSKIQEIL